MSANTNRPATHGFSWADTGILLTVLIWGGNMVVVKAALSEIPPLAFTALRFIGAAVIETILLHALGENLKMPWRDMRRTMAMALFGVVAYQGLFVLGIARTTAGNASVLLATIPILVALYNGVIKRQRLGANVWLGIALTIAGGIAYGLVLDWLGYAIATFVFMLFVSEVINIGKHWQNLVIATVFSTVTFSVFSVLLKLSLPRGLLGAVLPF